MQILGVLYLE